MSELDKKRLRSFVTGAAVMVVVAALVVLNGRWSLRHCGKLRSPRPGKPAPAFELPRLDGTGSFKLASARGKVVVVDFWATWCGPCLRKMPLLEKMQGEWGKRGLRVVGVNVDHSVQKVRAFFRAREKRGTKSNLLIVRDTGRISARYGVRTLPHVVVIGRDGNLVHVQVGTTGHHRLRAAVRAALAGKI